MGGLLLLPLLCLLAYAYSALSCALLCLLVLACTCLYLLVLLYNANMDAWSGAEKQDRRVKPQLHDVQPSLLEALFLPFMP